ncbi:uncharacterized protein LOC125757161 isoform X1 [Rhipicephalus sanguineus]|uniref:uncharacterized protein LOC125757161 isoform X1 n=1 Tax=Rhipicephalus sanguineus TaxID=34632 RepID=UPI0020C5B073|nr:uncharacterized protein LOC125757161 isoform X1 [Rhipicephalus sanguineus]
MCEDLKMDSLIMSELEKPHGGCGGGDAGSREYYPSPYASSKLPDISRRGSEGDDGDEPCPRAMAAAGVSMSPYASARMVEHTYDVPQHPRDGSKSHAFKSELKHSLCNDKLQNHIEMCKKEQYYQRLAGKGRPSAYGYSGCQEPINHSSGTAYRWSEPGESDRPDRWCLSERDLHLSAFHTPCTGGNLPEFNEMSDTECDRDLERLEQAEMKYRSSLQRHSLYASVQ